MRRRKKECVRAYFRARRYGDEPLFSIGLMNNTIRDLYAYIVLGYDPKKMQSVRKQMIVKNRHPGRKNKYKKKFEWKWGDG